MAAPLVSVLIPCSDPGKYIEDVVASVQAQTLQDLEILIIDANSTDEQSRLLLTIRAWPNTRVLHLPDSRISHAKNQGLARATGRYVTVLDPHDVLAPTFLERHVEALEANPTMAFASHWVLGPEHDKWTWMPNGCGFPALLDANTVSDAAVVRREVMEAVGGFDESFTDHADAWDLWLTLFERGYRGEILPEVLLKMTDGTGVDRRPPGERLLSRALVDKHEASYRAHLPGLIMLREREMARLRREIRETEFEDQTWIQPQLAKLDDDVRVLTKKMQTHRTLDEALRTSAESQEAADKLRLDLKTRQRQLDVTRSRVAEMHAEATRLRTELEQIQDSLTWQLTAPMRRVWQGIRVLIGLGPEPGDEL